MSIRYFLSDSEMVPVAPVTAGIALVLTFHARCPSAVKCSYFKIVSASFSITFLSPETAVSTNMHVPSSLAGVYNVLYIVDSIISLPYIYTYNYYCCYSLVWTGDQSQQIGNIAELVLGAGQFLCSPTATFLLMLALQRGQPFKSHAKQQKVQHPIFIMSCNFKHHS